MARTETRHSGMGYNLNNSATVPARPQPPPATLYQGSSGVCHGHPASSVPPLKQLWDHLLLGEW